MKKDLNISSNPTKENIATHFDNLTRSGFDFVDHAITSFSEDEKVSLFLFATGVELILKARLYHEHWSLIFANVDQANFKNFETGDLKTVGADKIQERIKQIIGNNIPISFEDIRKHRNRIAHFTHGETAEQRVEIISHQVRGWFDLYSLIRHEWRPVFKKYRNKVNALENKMRQHSEFLDAKFQAIQPDLKNEKQSGNKILDCPACKYKAMATWKLGGAIYHGNCRVCGRIENYIKLSCQNNSCQKVISFFASDLPPTFCTKCNEPIRDNIKDLLDTDPISYDEYGTRSEINCPHCGGYHTVVTHHDGFVCSACFEYEDEVGVCDWCSDGQLGGVGEYSSLSGCDFCDGRIGWEKD